MSSKYGRITSYVTTFEEEIDTRIPEYKAKIQIAQRENADKATIQVWIKHTKISNKYGFSSYAPSFEGMKALISAFLSIYPTQEVERELGIKIKGGEK